MNNTAKKQNRILLATLAVTLGSLALLIAITGSANKKSSTAERPPLDGIVETAEESLERKDLPKPSGKLENDDKHTESEKESEKKPEEPKKDAVAESESNVPTSAPAETLPTFSAPVDGLVLKGFSTEAPVFSYTMNDYRTHGGIDLAASVGTAVRSAADGTVAEITNDPMMGVTVAVKHSGGAVSRYKGLTEDSLSLCKVGDAVKAGEVIGAVGQTALIESAEDEHLHFELTVGGKQVDPAEYMALTFLADIHEG